MPVPATDTLPTPSTSADGRTVVPAGTTDPLGGAANRPEGLEFLAAPGQPDEIGRLGPYRVLAVLGKGSMGVVLKAEDEMLGRVVALKALLPALTHERTNRERFLTEARAAAAVAHDHVITIFQVGEAQAPGLGPIPYLAMSLLEGEALEDRLRREDRLSVPEVLRIGRETAEGLAAAHEKGLIHRDIKPANLWLEGKRGRVKILDFGLARPVSGGQDLTQTGVVLGTPAYMAPEQARGERVDARCDLFSLGCVLYQAATGERPFRGEDVFSTLLAIVTEQTPRPELVNPDLPPPLAGLILRLLEKDRGRRPASAAEVAETLRAIEAEGTTAASAPGQAAARSTPARRGAGWATGGKGRLALLLGVVLVVTAAGVVGWLGWQGGRPTEAVPATPPNGVVNTARPAKDAGQPSAAVRTAAANVEQVKSTERSARRAKGVSGAASAKGVPPREPALADRKKIQAASKGRPAAAEQDRAGAVNDEGKFFSAEAKARANEAIQAIRTAHNRSLVIETSRELPADKRKAFEEARGNPALRSKLFSAWADERRAALKADVLLLLSREGGRLVINVSPEMREKVFTHADSTRLSERLREPLKARDYDAALREATTFVANRLANRSARP
jgi:hypothetical protein